MASSPKTGRCWRSCSPELPGGMGRVPRGQGLRDTSRVTLLAGWPGASVHMLVIQREARAPGRLGPAACPGSLWGDLGRGLAFGPHSPLCRQDEWQVDRRLTPPQVQRAARCRRPRRVPRRSVWHPCSLGSRIYPLSFLPAPPAQNTCRGCDWVQQGPLRSGRLLSASDRRTATPVGDMLGACALTAPQADAPESVRCGSRSF